tara:strand:- start:10468 stop:11298 length:831 start_codon:yes stop_codon:yes gene_type:complete
MGVSRGSAEESDWVALREDDGRAYLVNRNAGELKIKGLGRFNCKELLSDYTIGDRIKVGQKSLTIVDAALPEARRNMSRRAQTIGIKDSGFLISWMGLGIGSRVLEGGHGSAGLAMHLANVMGSKGCLISVENRSEHAEVGKHNMERMREFMPEFPEWHLLEMELVDAVSEIDVICKELDAAIIDIAEPWTVVANISEKIKTGGRIACYCPTTSQLEKSWEAVEKQNMIVEFAGEMIERRWSKAGRGGVRPGNQPMGHTAFLLIAAKIAPHDTEEE